MWLQVILVVIFSAIGSTLLILGLLCIEYIVFKLRVKVKDKYFKELKKENNFVDFCCNNIGIYVLADRSQYNKATGLSLDNHWLEEVLMI